MGLTQPALRGSTSALETSGGDPRASHGQTTQMRALWPLSAPSVLWKSGGQDGRRWGEEVRGFRVWWEDRVWGRRVGGGEGGDADKASVVLQNWGGTTVTLWHRGRMKTYTHIIHYAMCALSPPSLQHSGGRKWKKIELPIGSQQLEAALMLFSKCWTCVEAQVSVAVAVSQLECVFPRNNLCFSTLLSEIVHAERALLWCWEVKVTGLRLSWKTNRMCVDKKWPKKTFKKIQQYKIKSLGMIGLMRVF